MKSIKNAKIHETNINSACNVVNLQSGESVHEPVRDSDLIIDINSENDDRKSYLSSDYDLEQDVEKLIEVSKQFQKDFETVKDENICDIALDDRNKKIINQVLTPSLNSLISRLTPAFQTKNGSNDADNYYFSNCSSASKSKKENFFTFTSSQRNKIFTSELPNSGPFGTGILRPPPKKHSCIENEVTSIKRSYRAALNIRPYSTRYYNFNRTHPHLQLVENADTIIPKRIFKQTTINKQHKATSTTDIINKKPLLNKGITWHEFLERSNIYSAKSVQSLHGATIAASTQTAFSESLSPKLKENFKIQKHILPQLNIRAECCVQRIPEISIDPIPNEFKRDVTSNIKLVEIVYEESQNKMEVIPVNERVVSMKEDQYERNEQPQSDSEYIPSTRNEVNKNTQVSESQISLTASSMKTSSNNHGYDSSLEQSISLKSRASPLTDHEEAKTLVPNNFPQPQKPKRFVRHRQQTNVQRTITSSSDCSDFQYDGKYVDWWKIVGSSKECKTFQSPSLNRFLKELKLGTTILFSLYR